MGLKEGQEKMSKSDPDSAIFMEDAAEDIRRKVSRFSYLFMMKITLYLKELVNILIIHIQMYHNHIVLYFDSPIQIKKAYCPPEVVEKNPIIDYAKHIVIGYYGSITISINGVCDIFFKINLLTYLY